MSWETSLHLPAPARLKVLHDFFLSLPPSSGSSRRPRQDVLVSNGCPAEWAERDGRVDVMGDGSGWLVAHSGRGYEFALDLPRAFEGGEEVAVSWLNTYTGKEVSAGKVRVDTRVAFSPPEGTGERSAVLVLRRS